MNLQNINTLYKKQEGATLFIGLILLFIITLVCITAMRTSLLELVMANNTQQSNNAFQAAESVLENGIVNLSVNIGSDEVQYIQDDTKDSVTGKLVNAADYPVGVVNETVYKGSGGALQAKASGNVFLRSITAANGWQLDLDARAFHFRMEINAESASGKAISNNSAGFFIVAPVADGSN